MFDDSWLDKDGDVYLQASLTDDTGGAVRDPRDRIVHAEPCLVRPTGGSSDSADNRAAQVETGIIYFGRAMGLDRRHAIEVEGLVYSIVSSVDANRQGELDAYTYSRVVT
jgi:hypothetical protein